MCALRPCALCDVAALMAPAPAPQISAGSRDALAARTPAGYAVPEAVDADRQICAKYYVNQILSLDEDSLRRSWNKVSRANRDNQLEKDARIEYLSWRVWAMKRKRAAIAARQSYLRRATGEEDDESDERTALLYLDDLDTTVNLEPLTEEVDPADPAAAQLLAEPLSSDQATVPDTDRPDDQSWDAVYPATAVARQAAAAARATAARAPAAAAPESAAASFITSATRTTAGTSVASPSAFSAPASSTLAPTTTATIAPSALHPSPIPAPSAAAAPSTASGPASPIAAAAAAAAAAGRIGGNGAVSPRATAASPVPVTAALQSPSTAAGAAGVAASAVVSPPTDADLGLLVNRYPRLYVVLISLHGLVRGTRMELGRDPDTGGQVKYVVELARALGRIPSVARVDLLTRLIADPKVDKSYSEPEERLDCGGGGGGGAEADSPGGGGVGGGVDEATGAFIVRLPCGPPDVYLKKEDLWPHIREFSDRALRHVSTTLGRLAGGGTPAEMWAVHGHYADAGEAAALIAASLGCPMLMTGHSLGRNKKAHLLASGSVSLAEVEATYRISRRIEAEERALDSAAVVFTSTQQEVKEQWGLYDGYREQLAAALSQRGVPGLHVPSMAVIPPGLDFSSLKVALPQDPITQLLERHRAALAAKARTPTNSGTRRGTPLSLTAAPSLEAALGGGGGGGGTPAAGTRNLDDPLLTAAAAVEVVAAAAAVGPDADAVLVPATSSPLSKSPPTRSGWLELRTASPSSAHSPSSGSTSLTLTRNGIASPAHGATTPPLRPPRPLKVTTGFAAGPASPAAAPGRSPLKPAGGNGCSSPSPFANPPTPTRRGLAASLEAEATSGAAGPAGAAAAAGAAALSSPFGSTGGGALSQPQPSVFTEPPIWREVHRFLRNPAKPVILAMSRPDAKKNVAALIKAYGSSAVLRDLANLVLVLGNRDVIDSMASGSARVMEGVLKLVDAYDLYGSVAYPKRHSQSDISDIYHLAAATRGVFVNAALQEPFGLTLIEAAAHGVPIVATCHGGPVDIVATLRNGVTVEPGDVGAIAAAITDIITRPDTWETYSNNGRNNILAYSWPSHVLSYLRLVEARRAADPQLAGPVVGLGLGALGAAGGGPGAAGTAAPSAAAGGGGGGGPAGCHGSPGAHMYLRTAFSLSYDDLLQSNHPDGGQAFGAALDDLMAGRATSLPFGLPPDVVAAAAAGLAPDSAGAAAAVAAAAADLLRRSGAAGDGAGGGSSTPNLNTSSMPLIAPGGGGGGGGLEDLQLTAGGGGGGGGAGAAAAAGLGGVFGSPHPGVGGGFATELFPGARLSLAARGGGRWLVFACDCAADLIRAGAALAALAAARRSAAERCLPLADLPDQLHDSRLSALLRHALAGPAPAADGSETSLLPATCLGLGLGVLSCMGCTDTRALLVAGGGGGGGAEQPPRQSLLRELDFVACNNACQLWVTGAKLATGGASSGGGGGGEGGGGGGVTEQQDSGVELLFDERYERHMEHRWEATAAKQVVRRILSNRSGWGKLPLGRPGHPAPRISALGPYHIMVTFTGAAARDVDPAALRARFRRKLRLSGLRAQVVVTPAVAPSSAGRAGSTGVGIGGGGVSRAGSLAAPGVSAATADGSSSASGGFTLHVVPLRASRALVLRYLSYRYGIPLEDVTVAAFHVAAAGGDGDAVTAAAADSAVLRCSDGEDLVAGQPRVVLLPAEDFPAADGVGGRAVGSPAAPGGGFALDLSPYATSSRVAVLF
ncbi:hypothetical protein PLESTM_001427200 [Pleodorina starrii]|nr:hypothetical protein PLESTM_001427200 [Pleodorina starrii]